MTNNQNIESLRNSTVYGNNGDKIGKVGEIYLDDQTNEPTFATVNTGLFGSKETFVPLNQARASDDGLTVPYDKDFVKDAPNIDDDGSLSPEEEQRIYEYYSLDGSNSGRDNSGNADAQGGQAGNRAGQEHGNAAAGTAAAGTAAGGTAAAGTADGRDGNQAGTGRHSNGQAEAQTRGGNADQAGAEGRQAATGRHGAADNDVVAHEERLAATDQTERRETGQVRLRKHVKTDTETVEVPVRHEEVQVERTKIDPDSAEARQAAAGNEFGEDEDVTVTAYEERPVVDTETVATERVSLNKQAREDTETVSGQVRKEEIEVDDEGNRRN
ncbi:DUF2382 domain-containing protein [Rothia uropygialis]|uniref:DUF2382 domain-containing protein n=1 Tax=Kocuria sp. 36 TaxID=1415402 RepID=UPI00101BBAA4|nr:PRC and DUF2382 domain-containing protein [Kocuria sp. 36]